MGDWLKHNFSRKERPKVKRLIKPWWINIIMIQNKIIRKIVELKEDSIQVQDYEMASKLRDIEKAFTDGVYNRTHR
jgi:protein-arginine kinase activator protein McsA